MMEIPLNHGDGTSKKYGTCDCGYVAMNKPLPTNKEIAQLKHIYYMFFRNGNSPDYLGELYQRKCLKEMISSVGQALGYGNMEWVVVGYEVLEQMEIDRMANQLLQVFRQPKKPSFSFNSSSSTNVQCPPAA
jgi:hypothetical protein